jgi:plastocyanin domain-containing protein
MKIKTFLMLLGLVIVCIGGGILLFRSAENGSGTAAGSSNIAIADGTQIIEITAKGGYAPRNTEAKAEMPTTLKVKTNGTFDCSSSLTIPSIGYRGNLPTSGETPITIPPQKPGTLLRGLCSMGMYSFTIQFN